MRVGDQLLIFDANWLMMQRESAEPLDSYYSWQLSRQLHTVLLEADNTLRRARNQLRRAF